jgi:hypothetical protein
MINGEPAETMDFMYFEFVLGDDGQSASFDQRNQDDEVEMKGTRIR